jgi:hypothetical protein
LTQSERGVTFSVNPLLSLWALLSHLPFLILPDILIFLVSVFLNSSLRTFTGSSGVVQVMTPLIQIFGNCSWDFSASNSQDNYYPIFKDLSGK